MNNEKKALVLFSGGQDSTTCLADALNKYDYVETMGFEYGQRHNVEMNQRLTVLESIKNNFPKWKKKLGNDHIINAGVIAELGATALTTAGQIKLEENGLPNTFVPARNILFLTLAAALAWRRGLKTIVTGVCETDYSGYPDCRDDTIKALQVALNLGLDNRFVLETPLMWLDKAQTWEMAHNLGGDKLVNIIINDSHTCYLGDRANKHDWGFGCGNCPACQLRANGYKNWIN